MLDALKTLILDLQALDFETGIPRRVDIVPLPGKATVCMGVRRSGKSTWMFQRIRSLRDAGVPRENILYLNFFDDRLHRLQSADPGLIIDAYFSLYPHKKGTETIYCFLDEIQVLRGWESLVDRLMRTERCDVWITGSSAQMLSREIATQMRGRALSWEMFPFSFREFLDARGLAADGHLPTRQRLLVAKAFEEYREVGGFPEVIDLDRRLRVRIHQEYFGAMLFRDIVERHDIAHPRAVSDLAHWLVDNTASLYSVNNLTGYLKSLGHKVPKASVSDYMAWFEDAYAFFTVRIFDASLARANTNPKKVYCIDHAMVTSVGSGILVNAGHLLENLVFIALRRRAGNVHYYRCRSGREVDFIVRLADDAHAPRMLVQVCESLAHPATRARELTALDEAMRELGLTEGVLVTTTVDEEVPVSAGTVRIVPAWRFLLELDVR